MTRKVRKQDLPGNVPTDTPPDQETTTTPPPVAEAAPKKTPAKRTAKKKVAADSDPEEKKKPAKRKPAPRKKSPAKPKKPAAAKASAAEKDAPTEEVATEAKPEEKKVAAKKAPRSRARGGRGKTAAAKAAEQKEAAETAEAKPATTKEEPAAEAVIEEKKKSPRKATPRPGRNKAGRGKPAASAKAEEKSEAVEAVEAKPATPTEETGSETTVEEKQDAPKASPRPRRKRGGRGKSKATPKPEEKSEGVEVSEAEQAAPTEEAGSEATTEEKKDAPKPSPRSGRKRGGRGKSNAGPKPDPKKTGKDQSARGGNKQETTSKIDAEAAKKYRLLINAEEPEECRLALLENGKLESFFVKTVVSEQTKGNVYKCRVVSVESNLQAAFIDLGTEKNGFLAFSEIHPEYYRDESAMDSHWKDLKIEDMIKIGQEMLVEVVKEPTGNKGANMTTYLSLPGRYVVLMPGSESQGISRKIDNEAERRKLKEMLQDFAIPEGVGYIIRTASKEITKTALGKDIRFLVKLWKEIKKRGLTMKAPALIYQEQDIIGRFLRDHFTPDIQEILVDSQEAFEQVDNFLELLPAAQRKNTSAKLHNGPRPLLNSFNVEEQIEQIYHPTVKLPSGGSIVINPTEALVAIDVNSGRTDKENFEETIFQANVEAAEELARQLRLRDLGGLVVVDFIDMRISSHTREVEKRVKACMKRDKAKVDFSRISKFGLMQISRQRMGTPVQAGNYITCPHCQGRGTIRSVETQALAYLRQIQTAVTRKKVERLECSFPIDVANYLLNKKRGELADLEKRGRVEIVIEGDPTKGPSQGNIRSVRSK